MPQTRLSGLREFETFVEPKVEKKVALSVRDLSKWYGNEQILDNVSFSVAEGESLVLLGPSGSGKSTTLRLIAGLDTPDGGDVFLGGRHIEHLRARERNIGVIFQNYALFPRMTIADNIAFGLRIRGKGKKQRLDVVEKLLAMIGLSDQRNKYPAQLSGGQQQRVAIARALAYEPDLLLFDESFSALDPQTRTGLRREIRSLLRKLKVPALFITHDQEEAMELGDHIAILNKGRLEQIGTPQEVYNNPQTEFVATFLGAANVVELCRNDRFVALDCRQCLTQLPRELALDRVKIVFRPEDVLLSPALGLAEPHDHLGIGEVQDIAFTGATEIVKVKLQRLNPPSHPAALDCQPTPDQACDLIIKALRTKWEAQRVPLNPGESVSVWLRDHRVL
ncbi:MAG TPA: ABC transporter ATP-binding protein [Blastocatellia bacterium]|nr:ABC transporter ATP-binding protein [Blastocatellia bacterium]HMV87381.1 ABC transporter ATP-binding protein [Blastocatellia bacterium]HMY74902.1 ABC transporter ATP-binding protein [Blastocatellia bacterium]HMZ19594.1 ABC transporter ATP-binding protein [Blastocatellia bacterium]HNG33669.1 ABC transporter ATP-binding protein [Blastocatellia bacterium]